MTYEEFKTSFNVINHPYYEGIKAIDFCGDDFYGIYTFTEFAQLVYFMVSYLEEIRKEFEKNERISIK